MASVRSGGMNILVTGRGWYYVRCVRTYVWLRRPEVEGHLVNLFSVVTPPKIPSNSEKGRMMALLSRR